MQELANRYLLVNGDGDNKHILTEQKNNFQNNIFNEYVDSESLLYPIPNSWLLAKSFEDRGPVTS